MVILNLFFAIVFAYIAGYSNNTPNGIVASIACIINFLAVLINLL